MKKMFTIGLVALITMPSFALRTPKNGGAGGEQWIVVGARGTFRSTWLLNSNQLNDEGLKYKPSWGGIGWRHAWTSLHHMGFGKC